MSRTSEMMWAFIAGATAGAIGGILLAPDKGSVTRRKVKEGAVRMYDGGRDRIHALGDAFAEGKQAYLREVNHVK
jgi:gas vesicle protein